MSRLLFLSGLLILTACQYGDIPENIHHQIISQSISLNNAELKTCTFHPFYRIVHFPMYHHPDNGQYDNALFDQTTKSQFQLLQTIIAYKSNISVFDEHITRDGYDTLLIDNLRRGYSQGTYTRLDGVRFQLLERYKTAFHLFGNGIPRYYEHLSQVQKTFLFDVGASMTLLFLGLISKIHKVISPENFNLVKENLRNPLTGRIDITLPNSTYWVMDFREEKLKKEVLEQYTSSTKLILIAYGANHDFSDDFQGYPFQSGHFCLNWLTSSFQFPPS